MQTRRRWVRRRCSLCLSPFSNSQPPFEVGLSCLTNFISRGGGEKVGGHYEVARLEAFGEFVVDGLQHAARFICSRLEEPETRKIVCRPQPPRQGADLPGNRQRLDERFFRLARSLRGGKDCSLYTQLLGHAPLFVLGACAIDLRKFPAMSMPGFEAAIPLGSTTPIVHPLMGPVFSA